MSASRASNFGEIGENWDATIFMLVKKLET